MPPRKFVPVDQMPPPGTRSASTSAGLSETPAATGIVPYVPVDVTKFDRKQLQAQWKQLSARTMNYILGNGKLEELLAETKLKDMAILMGISTEKMLLLEGQPTQIIGQAQQQKLDQLGTALQTIMQQRGLAKQVKLTERTATIELEGK